MDKGSRAAVGTTNQGCTEYLLGLGKQLPPYLRAGGCFATSCWPVCAQTAVRVGGTFGEKPIPGEVEECREMRWGESGKLCRREV